jgi:TolA-binding protein
MAKLFFIKIPVLLIAVLILAGCNHTTHQIISKDNKDTEDPEPVYDVTLDDDYQDFVSYLFMGNRSLNFSTFFNVYYTARDNYDLALTEYRTNTIAAYNRRLDSININSNLSAEGKEQLNEVIEGASKVLQYRKSSRFIDDAVLLIGKSYYYLNDFLQAERKFNEFLSKMNMSELKDEATLFLGKTKMKLGKTQDAETLLKSVVTNAKDENLKSEAAQELAIYAVTKKDYETAIKYFEQSINFAGDSDLKAEKQYILAKIYSISKPLNAAGQYKKAMDLTSDFDLSFFSKLNYAKSLTLIKDYRQSAEMLEELDSKYREYPEYKQLAELEIANNLYAQGRYDNALRKYYEVIVEYPGTISASDAYYYIAKHHEERENNYLNALVNYLKVNEESASSDFSALSHKKAATFDRYFVLEGIINGTDKIEIPKENLSVESYRREFNEENNTTDKNSDPNNPGQEEGAKGMKGYGYPPADILMDSLESDETIKLEEDLKTETDSLFNPVDTTTQTTVEQVTTDPKFDAYFELAELFYYSLGRADSAEFYLNKILTLYDSPEQTSKTLYALANIYQNTNRTTEANNIFNRIISEFPGSIFANESRKILGVPLTDVERDEAEGIYNEASNSIYNKNYDEAASKLSKLINEYPGSSYIPNALYSLGWIYENVYSSKDSATMYYGRLRDGYPQTEFYARVSGKLEAIDKQNGNVNSKEENLNTEEKEKEIIVDPNVPENPGNEEIPKEVLDEIQKQNNEPQEETGDDDGRR